MLTGMGTAEAAGGIMALGLDPRFDLRKAYWISRASLASTPCDASLGSAASAEWVVDGDLAYEIDGREIPADWSGSASCRSASPNRTSPRAQKIAARRII